MKLQDAEGYVVMAAAAAVLLAVVYVMTRGVKGAVHDTTSGAVGAVAGAVTGVVDGVSDAAGIPNTGQTTTDPRVARWLIDAAGYWQASLWSGVPALMQAMTMPEGSGTPPPAGSALALRFPQTGGATGSW